MPLVVEIEELAPISAVTVSESVDVAPAPEPETMPAAPAIALDETEPAPPAITMTSAKFVTVVEGAMSATTLLALPAIPAAAPRPTAPPAAPYASDTTVERSPASTSINPEAAPVGPPAVVEPSSASIVLSTFEEATAAPAPKYRPPPPAAPSVSAAWPLE